MSKFSDLTCLICLPINSKAIWCEQKTVLTASGCCPICCPTCSLWTWHRNSWASARRRWPRCRRSPPLWQWFPCRVASLPASSKWWVAPRRRRCAPAARDPPITHRSSNKCPLASTHRASSRNPIKIHLTPLSLLKHLQDDGHWSTRAEFESSNGNWIIKDSITGPINGAGSHPQEPGLRVDHNEHASSDVIFTANNSTEKGVHSGGRRLFAVPPARLHRLLTRT